MKLFRQKEFGMTKKGVEKALNKAEKKLIKAIETYGQDSKEAYKASERVQLLNTRRNIMAEETGSGISMNNSSKSLTKVKEIPQLTSQIKSSMNSIREHKSILRDYKKIVNRYGVNSEEANVFYEKNQAHLSPIVNGNAKSPIEFRFNNDNTKGKVEESFKNQSNGWYGRDEKEVKKLLDKYINNSLNHGKTTGELMQKFEQNHPDSNNKLIASAENYYNNLGYKRVIDRDNYPHGYTSPASKTFDFTNGIVAKHEAGHDLYNKKYGRPFTHFQRERGANQMAINSGAFQNLSKEEQKEVLEVYKSQLRQTATSDVARRYAGKVSENEVYGGPTKELNKLKDAPNAFKDWESRFKAWNEGNRK